VNKVVKTKPNQGYAKTSLLYFRTPMKKTITQLASEREKKIFKIKEIIYRRFSSPTKMKRRSGSSRLR